MKTNNITVPYVLYELFPAVNTTLTVSGILMFYDY